MGSRGTVGGLTGGLIAQNGIDVYLLSRTMAGAEKGLRRAIKQARSEVIRTNITCGDYDTMLAEALGKADLIIESVTENLLIKQQVYEMIDELKRRDIEMVSPEQFLDGLEDLADLFDMPELREVADELRASPVQ